MSWERLYRVLQPETAGTLPGSFASSITRWSPSASRSCSPTRWRRWRQAHHQALDAGFHDRLRVLFRRVSVAARRRSGRAGCLPPRMAGAAQLGRVGRGRVRSPWRASGGPRRRLQPQLCQPLRLYLGVQAGPLCAGAGEPAAGHQPRPPRTALGAARFRDRASRRRQPRLSARARRAARAVRLDPARRCGGRS